MVFKGALAKSASVVMMGNDHFVESHFVESHKVDKKNKWLNTSLKGTYGVWHATYGVLPCYLWRFSCVYQGLLGLG
jgi:hypothetical protein